MPRWRSILSTVLLPTVILAQFNPCLIDRSACVPFYDFDVGCTCILQATSADFRNTSRDDVVMIIMGNAFPLRIFDQYVFPQLFRDKLDFRIPSERDYEYEPELPETIYQSLSIDETMTLFVGNASLLPIMLNDLTNQSYLQSAVFQMLQGPSLHGNLSRKYCDEGECSLFMDEVSIYNKTSGDYEMTTDLLHIIQLGSRMVVAASSVSGHFSIPLVHRKICQRTCGDVPRPHISMCERTCEQRSRYDQIAVTGEYKREFQMFLRAACVRNFRAKYRDFLTGKASISPLPTRKSTTKRTTIRTTPKTTTAKVAGRATVPSYMARRPGIAPPVVPRVRPPTRPGKTRKPKQNE
ncbi:hypothetical protein PRIPAC_94526 [Pristionchus pacificus]|uniref:Uncharacterized protein n=1 Tax=Pristionchus pacificus TaxID=54126 RepID=A0A2A6BBF8_PRIPA|nr:hypothetical protein PRIPAC_94526 [Pristionchus pacificus]|eukprot:PDM63222.1 hypothetical protein PRIPAC_50437 [Pristionchus pacificus]